MKTILRSIGAAVAGILVGALLSHVTDFALESAGVLPHGNLYVAAWLIWVVIIYRTLYNLLGFYLMGRLAPSRPMRLTLIVGVIGTAGTAYAAYATANMHLGPSWYAWTLAALVMPCAWLAGRLCEKRAAGRSSSSAAAPK